MKSLSQKKGEINEEEANNKITKYKKLQKKKEEEFETLKQIGIKTALSQTINILPGIQNVMRAP